MTDEQEAALRAVVEALRQSATGEQFAARFGPTLRSERRPRGLRVELADGPFGAFELRPWTNGSTGVVDIELRSTAAPISVDALQSAFGPFEETPRLESARPWWAAEIGGEGVGVLMSVAVVRERVDEIVLRRDPVFTD